ncbi:MAG: MFS transporter [Nocardioides sp.]|uniref:MFS transporter n=1 Tax=Nocardioides sp. TaxID=35761 RepID=UPI003F015D01
MTPSPQPRLLLTALVVITTATSVVSSLGAPLVPLLATHFEVSLTDAQWSLTASLLTSVVATPLLGRLGSGRRRRPVVLTALALVLLGTVVAAFSPSFWLLVAGRSLQGLGLSVTPLALAIAREHLPASQAPGALAVLSLTTVAGAGLGYPFTSFMAEHLGIRGAYLAGAVLMAITLAITVVAVPGAQGDDPQRTDVLGAGLIGVGLGGVLLALSRGETWGWTSVATLVTAGLGAALLAAFVVRTLRVPHPLVDLRLAVRPGLANANLVAFAAGVGMYSLLTLAVVVVQADWGLGRSVAVAGWVLVPYSLCAVIGTRLSQAYRRQLGVRYQLLVGCLVFGGACALMALSHDSLTAVLVAMGVGGIGSGFTFSSMAVIMVPYLPPGETGSAMALNMLLRHSGFTVGSAAAITLMHVFGGLGERGFTGALTVIVGLWVLTALASAVMDRRTPPSGAVPGSA